MAQILLGGKSGGGTVNAGTELDPMFTELYSRFMLWPVNPQVGAYTAVDTDAFSMIVAGGNVTLPNLYGATGGRVIVVYNNTGGNISLVQGSGLTLQLVGTNTTGTRTLASRGIALCFFLNGSLAVVAGWGVS